MFRSDGVWWSTAESYQKQKMRFARARYVCVSFMFCKKSNKFGSNNAVSIVGCLCGDERIENWISYCVKLINMLNEAFV